jgi:putative DNA primase/helicase
MTYQMRDEPPMKDDNYRPPTGSDDALAHEFVEQYASELRYVKELNRWFRWDGARWCEDKTDSAAHLARLTCRKAAATREEGGHRLASARTIAAVERLAKTDPRITATQDQFDADPWLLNTPGGVVELETGKLRPAAPEDYMTKITAVTPGGDCPQWLAFLNQIFPGDTALVAYLQRVCGYCLTGSTKEHALFFGFGKGQNGKGTWLNTVGGILCDYQSVAASETFTAMHSDRHPTELAALRGARLVSTGETQTGKQWDEAKIKSLTGGDPVTARFMQRDFFTYMPQFKLVITGNHKPGLRSVDMAMRRRFHLIPFMRIFSEEEKDADLLEKLKSEWPGILQWMIDGCREWQEKGLAPPAAVIGATNEYLESQDKIGNWLEECCVMESGAFVNRTALYESFSSWAKRSGEQQVGSAAQFYVDLEGHDGLAQERKRVGKTAVRVFSGLRLQEHENAFEPARATCERVTA